MIERSIVWDALRWAEHDAMIHASLVVPDDMPDRWEVALDESEPTMVVRAVTEARK